MSPTAAALTRFRTAYAAMLGAARALNTTLEQAARRDRSIVQAKTTGEHRAIALVQTLVAARYGFSVEVLLSRQRPAELVLARQVAMALCRDLTRHTFEEIGDAFFRDHNTAIWASRAIKNRCETDAPFHASFLAFKAHVRTALAQEPAAKSAA